jgi:hypothetical protein
MATTYTWQVSALNCYPTQDNLTDVVFNVHWQCVGTDGQYTASVYSTCSVPGPGNPFTPYANLTQDQVLNWIWANGVDKEATEANVAQQIQNQINPPVVTPPLPWSQA